ncbi:MAG TPA: hypothetical protein EYN67_07495 [Flavobacteriales bacterium]|nr:hypothetical protein [Flavobacteriales bacterium]
MSYSGTVHCGHCYEKGHNVRGCDKLRKAAEENPDSYHAIKYARIEESKKKPKVCSYCGIEGHTRRGCDDSRAHKITYRLDLRLWRAAISKWMDDTGVKIGALVRARVHYSANDNEYMDPVYENFVPAVCLIDNIDLDDITHYSAITNSPEWLLGSHSIGTQRIDSKGQESWRSRIPLALPCIKGIIPRFGRDHWDREQDRTEHRQPINWEVVSPGYKSNGEDWISNKALDSKVKHHFAGGQSQCRNDFRELTKEQRTQLQMYLDGTLLVNELIDPPRTVEK